MLLSHPDTIYNLLGKFGMGQVGPKGNLNFGSESFDCYSDDVSKAGCPASSTLFADQALLNRCHMIFLPCNSSKNSVAFVNNHAELLRNYVSAGGRIYNSCTVSLWTESAFPDMITFLGNENTNKFDIGRASGTAYQTTGQVLDPDMAAWIGALNIGNPDSMTFENGYVQILNTNEVVDGNHGLEEDGFVVKPYTWVKDTRQYPNSPLMVTYNYDAGKVFCTVYETSQEATSEITAQEYALLYVILEVGVCEGGAVY